MNTREEFKKWLADYVKQEPKNFNRFMYKLMTVKEAWQEATTRQQKVIDECHRKIESQYNMIKSIQAYGEALQKTIDELKVALEDCTIRKLSAEQEIERLKAENPDVHCPACKGEKKIIMGRNITDIGWCYDNCCYCNGKGSVSTVKALQYENEQLKNEVETLNKMQKG